MKPFSRSSRPFRPFADKFRTLLCTPEGKLSLLDLLYLLSGVFVAVCYLGYLLSIPSRGEYFALPVPLLVLALVLLPFLFRKKLKELLRRFYRPLKILFCCGMCFYMCSFSLFAGFLLAYGNHLPPPTEVTAKETPVVVVFGCRAYGKTPGTTLRNRLDRAYALLEEFPDAVCIVSGAKGTNESLPESEAMYCYLTEEKGISPERVWQEPEGSNSIENLRYSLDILDRREVENPHIFCVSSEFHALRILLIASRMDAQVTICSAPSDGLWNLFTSLVREYMAYVKLFVFGAL